MVAGGGDDMDPFHQSPFKCMSLPVQKSGFPSSLAPVELDPSSASVGAELPDNLLELGGVSPPDDKFPAAALLSGLPDLPEFDTGEPSPWLSDLIPSSGDNNNNNNNRRKPASLDQHMPSFGLGMQQQQQTPRPRPPPPLATTREASVAGPPKLDDIGFSGLLEADPEEAEEIVKQHDEPQKSSSSSWSLSMPAEWSVPWSGNDDSNRIINNAMWEVTRGLGFGLGSPEMLVTRFDKITCGILSVKDGAGENPWRTLIWPMARDTPALQHAVFSLAAFHSSRENPAFRVHGVDHMRRSIACMVHGIQNMRTDAALATSLALAFADTWDQHTRTCIQHLRGAKALVSQVLQDGAHMLARRGEEDAHNLKRVRFLYNTWLYMDVIARITSLDECGSHVLDIPLFDSSDNTVHEIDPLMGCATTLFPLIDRAMRLIQRVRRTDSNSVAIVSQAIELKALIERWEPPEFFEPPEDPTSEVQHGIQTAYAYRWATLLYLHQAVPEMPMSLEMTETELAKRILILLATVPLRSRTNIIHMFPLLVAGCEVDQEEDREWVMDRWAAVQARLMLGTGDRCLDVVREVWARRDAFEAEKKQQRQARAAGSTGGKDTAAAAAAVMRRGSATASLGNIEYEKTVRGRLHWVNVMREWEWEGEFSCISRNYQRAHYYDHPADPFFTPVVFLG